MIHVKIEVMAIGYADRHNSSRCSASIEIFPDFLGDLDTLGQAG
ncbi:MAG: hypothetical protein VKJ85_07465 [Prochlorothrix sp.]|nr:hypothetical protein [Prochlorothrix sp.]